MLPPTSHINSHLDQYVIGILHSDELTLTILRSGMAVVFATDIAGTAKANPVPGEHK